MLGILERIEAKLDALLERVQLVANELDTLTAQVSVNTTVEQSAIVLINGLAAQITALANDPAALLALASTLNTNATGLAAAVAANTPAAPPAGGAPRAHKP